MNRRIVHAHKHLWVASPVRIAPHLLENIPPYLHIYSVKSFFDSPTFLYPCGHILRQAKFNGYPNHVETHEKYPGDAPPQQGTDRGQASGTYSNTFHLSMVVTGNTMLFNRIGPRSYTSSTIALITYSFLDDQARYVIWCLLGSTM